MFPITNRTSLADMRGPGAEFSAVGDRLGADCAIDAISSDMGGR